MQATLIRFFLVSSLLLGGAAPLLAVEIHNLRSGTGVLGGLDAQITLLHGPQNNEFGVPMTPLHFAAADSGPAATILSQVAGVWINPLPADPMALWISEDNWGAWDGASNLYAIDFFVNTPSVSSATLDFHFACDNWLGDTANEGLFLNGFFISGTSGGNYGQQTSFLGLNVTSLVNYGPNTLYILSTDMGGPGGLVFSSTLTINDDGTVGADEQADAFHLGDAHPNPFNPMTTLSFSMAETGTATLTVTNLAGVEVARPWQGLAERGAHEVSFNGAALPSGLYLYTLSTEQGTLTRKMVLAK